MTMRAVEPTARQAENGYLATTSDGGVRSSAPGQPLGPVYAGLAVGALGIAGATAVGLCWASRPAAPRTVTMGPGGWVSFKGPDAAAGGPPPAVVGRAVEGARVQMTSTRTVRHAGSRPARCDR